MHFSIAPGLYSGKVPWIAPFDGVLTMVNAPGTTTLVPVDITYHSPAGMWVMVVAASPSATTNKYYTSTDDGASWTQRTLPLLGYWHNVVSNGTYVIAFIQMGSATATAAYRSIDGINWTAMTTQPGNYSRNMICTGSSGQIVGVGVTGAAGMYSPDGVTWSTTTLPTTTQRSCVAYTGTHFIVTPISAATNNYVLRSPDGINWSTVTIPLTATIGNGAAVSDGDGRIIITCASATPTYALSLDHGLTWTSYTLPSGASTSAAQGCYIKDAWVYAIHNSNKFWFTRNGLDWGVLTAPIAAGWGNAFASATTGIITGDRLVVCR